MDKITKDQLIVAMIRGIPYAEHISEIDTTSEENAIRFTWRRNRFRISLPSMMTEHVGDSFLEGNNLAILMETVVKRTWLESVLNVTEDESKENKA